MRTTVIALVLASLAVSLQAQNVIVGSQQVVGANYFGTLHPPLTVIDLAHPANADGTVTTAFVSWYATASCASSFKVKFLHPTTAFPLTTFTLVAERGPFSSQLGAIQVPLTPPVDIKQGDLLAVTLLQPLSTCGGVFALDDPLTSVLQVPGDVSSGTFTPAAATSYLRGLGLNARATDTQEVLEGVITAAGSLQGNFGSFFRTSLQIASPEGSKGKLVFHPAGRAASANDATLPYSLSSYEATSYDDIVQAMGQSGLGTIDVISTNGKPPLVTARVYNDGGPNGTAGFTEDLITPAAALHKGDLAHLLTPADLVHYRVNIGVRTFSSPVEIFVSLGNSPSYPLQFPANTFQQYSLTGFGDTTPIANERISLYVSQGDVIVYASTTDNRTNDSSVRFARRE